MTDDPLPNEDHVVRYCRPTCVDQNDIPTPAAFYLRDDEAYLSVNWLEYFGLPSTHDAIGKIRESFIARSFRLGKGAKFASLQIDDIKRILHKHKRPRLSFTHQPLEKNCSHSGIFGLPEGEDPLAALLLVALLKPDCVFPARA